MSYDPENVFAKILRGEIPCDKVFEDEHVLAFRDIQPQATVHVLVIPKGAYETLHDFAERGSEAELASWVRALAAVARSEGVTDSGYRILSNTGEDGGQEVAHVHMHLFGGAALGPMISAPASAE